MRHSYARGRIGAKAHDSKGRWAKTSRKTESSAPKRKSRKTAHKARPSYCPPCACRSARPMIMVGRKVTITTATGRKHTGKIVRYSTKTATLKTSRGTHITVASHRVRRALS